MPGQDSSRLREAKQRIVETRNRLAAIGGFDQLQSQLESVIGGTQKKGAFSRMSGAINTAASTQSSLVSELEECEKVADTAIERAEEDEKQQEQQSKKRRC